MGKGWTEEWQGLGCGEGGGKVGCAKACGQTFELARAGLRGLRCGGDDSQKVSEDYVLGAWMCPGPFPRCPQSPETGRDLAGICLWRAGKQGLLPSAGAQARLMRLQRDLLGCLFCFWLLL